MQERYVLEDDDGNLLRILLLERDEMVEGLRIGAGALRSWSTEQKNELGIKPLVETMPPDARAFDYSPGPVSRGGDNIWRSSWVVKEKPLEAVRDNALRHARSMANAALARTDWYIIRRADTGDEVPANIASERKAVRDACDALTDKIENAISGVAVLAAVDSAVWPV